MMVRCHMHNLRDASKVLEDNLATAPKLNKGDLMKWLIVSALFLLGGYFLGFPHLVLKTWVGVHCIRAIVPSPLKYELKQLEETQV